MPNTSFEIGDLVSDPFNQKGIVVHKFAKIADAPDFAVDKYPLDQWLNMQADKRVKKYKNKPWLDITPLAGGGAYCPEAMCKKIRKATKDDYKQALSTANNFAAKILKQTMVQTGVK